MKYIEDPNGFNIVPMLALMESDELRYRKNGWLDLADCCREYASQMRLGYWCAGLTRMQGLGNL